MVACQSAERLNLCLNGKELFHSPCFRSPVHGSGAELRCSGIASRLLRRKTDWSSWGDHCSRLGLHCKQRIAGTATLETAAGAVKTPLATTCGSLARAACSDGKGQDDG